MKRKVAPPTDIQHLRNLLSDLQSFRAIAKKFPNWGNDLGDEDYAMAMSILNPGSAGSRHAKRLGDQLGLFDADDLDHGDKKSKNGRHYEIKTTTITSTNKRCNFVQVRGWQDVDYIFKVIDARDLSKISIYYFFLTKEQFEKELKETGAVSSHGTGLSNKDNSNIEREIRIRYGSSIFNRWITEYGLSLSELKLKVK